MSQQDVKLRLAPGETKEIQRPGRFIFCKFSDRQVSIIMDQARIEMEAGDKHVSTDRFKSFQVQNLDQEREAYLIFVVGDGDFDRMLVQGEISIVPILRNADGTTKPDTRYPLNIQIAPEKLETTAYVEGNLVKKEAYLIPGASSLGTVSSERPRVFAGPGGYPVVTWYYNSRADGGWYQVDWNLNLIDSGSENLVASTPITFSSMSDNGWTPYAGFISCYSNDLYRAVGPDDEKEHLYSATFNINTFCYVPDTDSIILMDSFGEKFEEIDAQTYARKRVGTCNLYGGMVRWDWKTGRLYIFGNDTYEVRFSDFALLNTIPTAPTFNTGGVVRGNNIFGTFGSSSDPIEIENVVLYDYVTKPEFVGIRPGCELAQAAMYPQSVPQITAEVEVNQLFTGVELSGEIIKAALEYYFRREAPADYLDHVYYASLGNDRAGVPVKPLSSGNETFARAGITDDFTVLVPGQVAITIDNELQMGSML